MDYNTAEKVVRCDNLDVSDREKVEEICTCLDEGWQVQVFSINKSDPKFVPEFTFWGEKSWQSGEGITLTGYSPFSNNVLVDIG